MSDQELYFNSNGGDCSSSDDWVARKVNFASGSSRYFAKVNRVSRKLFNPNSEKDSELSGKSGGRDTFVSVEMGKDNFEHYIDFLETRNDLMYNNANSYRR